MPDSKAGLRLTLLFYARICLGLGVGLLVILGLLRLTSLLIDWSTPLDPAEWFTFATGLIVVAATLGPYVVTVGQLAKVKRIPAMNIVTGPPRSRGRQQLTWAIIGGVAVIFLAIIIIMRSAMVWFTFGAMFGLIGLLLLYICWRIGRFERLGNIIIFATDYSWHFDPISYIGMTKSQKSSKP